RGPARVQRRRGALLGDVPAGPGLQLQVRVHRVEHGHRAAPARRAVQVQSLGGPPLRPEVVADAHQAVTPARKSRMTRWNSSASSNCGECPDFSNTTSWAPGISSAIVSADDTGVTQSVRPTVTSVGQVTEGSFG